jgi:hypothetical protein
MPEEPKKKGEHTETGNGKKRKRPKKYRKEKKRKTHDRKTLRARSPEDKVGLEQLSTSE